MLARIYIQNYALIQELDLDLSKGFTAITGETGSGKSILLGALGLCLGERADTHVLFEKDLKCVVEADFRITGLQLESFFEAHDLDYLDCSTLRREISPNGRSRAFVNDTPVALSIMRSLAERLVDLHSQHMTFLLQDEDFQLSLLDIFANHGNHLVMYQKGYRALREAQEEQRKIRAYISDHKIDKDYLQFQLDELNEVTLSSGADKELEEELGLMEHAEEIKTVLHQAIGQLDQEGGLLDQLNSLAHRIDSIASHTKGLEELFSRTDSVRLELADIQNAISDIESQVELDPERQTILNEQMDAYQRLFTKHRCNDVDGLITLRTDIDKRLVEADDSHRKLKETEEKILALEVKLKAQAEVLTKARKKAAEKFVKSVSYQFADLSLANAQVDIGIGQSTDFQPNGLDEVIVLFNANKGGTLEELSKVASGGELSRLMLILKGELAKAYRLPTLIFDEIDTGVSGEIASQMAGKLREMSEGRQVVSITHLPQVAARAHQHYRISKSDTDERSITDVEVLDEDGRILELAKMLSGARISEASVENARDLLKN